MYPCGRDKENTSISYARTNSVCGSTPWLCVSIYQNSDHTGGWFFDGQRYPGHYVELFNDAQEKPIPIWSALAWILQDYGLSRTEQLAVNLVYKQISGPWFFEPRTKDLLTNIRHTKIKCVSGQPFVVQLLPIGVPGGILRSM